jgi:hypothetical protein
MSPGFIGTTIPLKSCKKRERQASHRVTEAMVRRAVPHITSHISHIMWGPKGGLRRRRLRVAHRRHRIEPKSVVISAHHMHNVRKRRRILRRSCVGSTQGDAWFESPRRGYLGCVLLSCLRVRELRVRNCGHTELDVHGYRGTHGCRNGGRIARQVFR